MGLEDLPEIDYEEFVRGRGDYTRHHRPIVERAEVSFDYRNSEMLYIMGTTLYPGTPESNRTLVYSRSATSQKGTLVGGGMLDKKVSDVITYTPLQIPEVVETTPQS